MEPGRQSAMEILDAEIPDDEPTHRAVLVTSWRESVPVDDETVEVTIRQYELACGMEWVTRKRTSDSVYEITCEACLAKMREA